jgi:subtilase family serine protease
MSWLVPSRSRQPSGRSAARQPRLEELERRDLLSAVGDLLASPVEVAPLAGTTTSVFYTPGQIRHAYGFDRVAYNGAGQTIAIVAAYDNPNIFNDTAVFDRQFGLPGQSAAQVGTFLTRVSERGSRTALPAPDRNWALEIALDVEWAHAIAPQAKILLVEAVSASGADLMAAVDYARHQPGVSVVSMSWGSREFNGEASFDSAFTTPPGHAGVTFVAAAGDSGAAAGPEWPAVSPNVLAVGGTSLRLTSNALRSGETVWAGGGGGYSGREAEPTYQRSVQGSGRRATPDVAYDADPATGVYLYSSYGTAAGRSGWFAAGGTSAGAPQWAGLIALVDQARAQVNRAPIGDVHAALYNLPARAFFDVTGGSNGFAAGPGYDTASGRGTPVVDQLIAGLLTAPVGAGIGAAVSPAAAPGTVPVVLTTDDATLVPALPPPRAETPGDAVWMRADEVARWRTASSQLDALAAEGVRAAREDSRRQLLLSGGGAENPSRDDLPFLDADAERASPDSP